MDPSVLNAIYKAVKRLSSSAPAIEQAMERTRSLEVPLDLIAPNSVARSVIGASPPRMDRANWGATVMTPSDFLAASPPLTDRDARIVEKLKAQIQQQQLKNLPEIHVDRVGDSPRLQQDGRHRMSALQQLQGDDPVLTHIIQGSDYNLLPTDPRFYAPGTMALDYKGANPSSPLDVLRQQLLAPNGTDLIKINPLWTN